MEKERTRDTEIQRKEEIARARQSDRPNRNPQIVYV